MLAPKPPVAGLTPDLGVIVRVEAESARHTALQTVASIETGDPGALAAAQPDYKWVAGNQPSADPHTVSVVQNPTDVTIAVAATQPRRMRVRSLDEERHSALRDDGPRAVVRGGQRARDRMDHAGRWRRIRPARRQQLTAPRSN